MYFTVSNILFSLIHFDVLVQVGAIDLAGICFYPARKCTLWSNICPLRVELKSNLVGHMVKF